MMMLNGVVRCDRGINFTTAWSDCVGCMDVDISACGTLMTSLAGGSSSSSAGCFGCWERPSGLCWVLGMWTRVKWMEMIQQLMLADGVRSGFTSIPLIYLSSTSTTRFLTLMRYAFSEYKAWNKPYSLSFGWEKWDSRLLSIIEPKHAKRQICGLSVSHWQSRNPIVICEVSMARIMGASDV